MPGTADDIGQIWYWKEILTLVSLVCSFMLIIPTARLLLALPYFKTLVEPFPKAFLDQLVEAEIYFGYP